MNDEQGTSPALDTTQSLPEIPDLSGMTEDRPEPWADGWYGAIVQASQQFEKDGMVTTYNTEDVLSRAGDSRNIFVRFQITRKDGRRMQTKYLINYRPSDFSAETIAAIQAKKAEVKAGGEWGSMFRAFSALTGIGTLQRIASVRQFQRTADGGLDLSPLVSKPFFARLRDDKDGRFKEVAAISDTAPKKGTL